MVDREFVEKTVAFAREAAEAWLERARRAGYRDFWQGEEPTPFREEGERLLDELGKAVKEIRDYVIEHGQKKPPYHFDKGEVYTVDPEDYMEKHPDMIAVDVSRYVQTAPEEPYDVSSALFVLRDAELAEKHKKLKELVEEIGDILDEFRFEE